jgi:endonuclease/exonuclease/phosphatase (EEP) superfamily protein YafD
LVLCGMASAWQLWPLVSYPLADPQRGATGGRCGVRLNFLTYNLLYSAEGKEATAQALRTSGAEVLALQEYTEEWQVVLKPALEGDFPYRWELPAELAGGLALYSKYPLPTKQFRGTRGMEEFIAAKVQVGEVELGLLVVHPPPPVGGAAYDEAVGCFDSWSAQIRELKTPRVVVAGDLNCTPFARLFQRLLRETGLRDSSQGYQLESTWYLHGLRPFGLPLDHVLVSPQLGVGRRSVGPDLGSDHRWLMVELEL